METEVQVVDDVPRAFATLVSRIAPATFALSGGSTAQRCYRELGEQGGDWSRTAFLLSDERWVPVEHPDSNEGQARREWLGHVPTGPIHSLRGAGDAIEEAARAYAALVDALGDIELAHLGLGDDGHTLSMFPGSPDLEVADRLVVATGDEHHEWPRLSLTFPAVERCRTVIVTATGEGKRDAFRRVQDGDPDLPATRLRAPRVVWLVDRAVAGG